MSNKQHIKRLSVTLIKALAASCIFVCLWCVIPASQAEIIDRIMAVVDNRIITLSDLRQERAIRAALGEPAPVEDKAMLEDLIERTLMTNQLSEFPAEEV